MAYEWDFWSVFQYGDMLAIGLLNTMKIGVISIVLGGMLGFCLALMRMSASTLLSAPALMFITFNRNTPAIVHFFWIYYALPILIDLNIDAMAAAIMALSMQSAAFYAEAIRGGIISIERGQWEAARAIGMRRFDVLRRIVLPQAVARMMPPMVERSFEVIKTTSLASTLAYDELLYQAMQVNSITFRPLEVYTVVAVMYLVLLSSASYLARRVERHMTRYR